MDRKNLTIYLDAGLYDLVRGKRVLLEESRTVRKILSEKGYTFTCHEFPGGHTWTCWRDQPPALLTYLYKP